MIWVAIFVAYEATIIAVAVYALRRGGQEERLAALALVATALGTQIVSQMIPRWESGPEYEVMTFDIILVGVLLAVVYKSRKFWPLWAAAASMVGVITHGARWLKPSLTREVYITIQPFWAIPVMLAIAVGTHAHRRS